MITSGTMLVEQDTPHPACFETGLPPYAGAWVPLKSSLTPRRLAEELSLGGWTFFYMAGKVKATVLGLDRERMMEAAVRRLIANGKSQKYNCLEIDEVNNRSFLGMPCVSISAHLRHLQKGPVFHGGQRGV